MGNFDSFGVKKGLAYRHDYGQIMENAFRLDELRERKTAQRKQESARLAEAFKTPYTNTNYNRKRMDAVVGTAIAKFEDFKQKNPFWKQDPKLVMEFNKIRDEIINNPVMAEELESQTQYQIMAEDNESSLEHKKQALAEYEAYANQDFQAETLDANGNPIKNNPYQSVVKSFKYTKEDTWSIYNTLTDLGKTILNPEFFSVEKIEVDKNGNNIVTKGFGDEKYEAAMLAIQGDPKYKRSLEKSFAQYTEGEKANERTPVYLNSRDYGMALLKNQYNNIREMQGQNQAYLERIRASADLKALYALPMHTLKLVDQLVESGKASAGTKGLVFTPYKTRLAYKDITGQGAMFKTPDTSSNSNSIDQGNYMDYFRNSQALSGGDMFYDPSTQQVLQEVTVLIDDDFMHSAEFKIRGFIPFEHYTKEQLAALEMDEEAKALFNDKDRKNKLIGTILVPANLTDRVNYYEYEAQLGGRAAGSQEIREAREDQVMAHTRLALETLKGGSNNPKKNSTNYVEAPSDYGQSKADIELLWKTP